MNTVSLSLVLALACAPMLEIGTDAGSSRRVALGPDARFSVSYWHSMYNVPFTEDYVIDAERRIRLLELRSDDGTVLDYYALEGAPGEVAALDRSFASLAFGIALNNPQTLQIGDRRWSFLDFGEAGGHVAFSVAAGCARQ